MASEGARRFDVVLFGATGFTGGLTAEYLAHRRRAEGRSLRWALAGRNREKLEAARRRLAAIDPACGRLALLKADAAEAGSLAAIATATSVVITTVGPYLRYGEPLLAACAAAGTDYVDLTGEPEFVDTMWLRHHAAAVASGARIVNCCGFDSIPHDLGAWFTVSRLPRGVPLKVEGFVRAGGTFSGGTLHSAVTAFSRIRESLRAGKARREREALPAGRRIGSTHERIHFERGAGGAGAWAMPMPTIDPQVVRRSAAASPRYGPDFRYGHYLLVDSLPTVALIAGGAGAAFAAAQFAPTRELLLRFKAAGEGPTEAQREKGWFRVRFVGEGGGERVVTEVSGGDPGYGETAKMLGESALCLAFDKLPRRSGVITPAHAMGEALIARLQAAGIRFAVVAE